MRDVAARATSDNWLRVSVFFGGDSTTGRGPSGGGTPVVSEDRASEVSARVGL